MLSRPLTLRPKEVKPPPGGSAGKPVAWWKLDETGGTEAADASGHARAARVEGAARWTPGRAGGALEFDGARGYADGGDAAGFDFRDDLSVALWLRLRAPGQSAQTIIAKGSDTWRVTLAGKSDKVVFALNGPQTTGKDRKRAPQVTSKTGLADGQWHHVAGAYDGKRIALYVDGELADAVTAVGLVALNTEPLWLGDNSAARSLCFNGWLDDVRLFAGGLSDEEVKAIYRETAK